MADCKIVYYNSSTSSIQLGNFLYQNQAQTIPVAAGYYAWANDDKWYQTDAEGVVILSGSCSPVGNIFTGGILSAYLLGCISSSTSGGPNVDNYWNNALITSSGVLYNPFILFSGTGSRDTAEPAIQVATASFQAYDFSFAYRIPSIDPTTSGQGAYQYLHIGPINTQTSSIAETGFTAQIWGAVNFNDSSSTYGYYSGSQLGLLDSVNFFNAPSQADRWKVYYSSSQQLLYVSYFTGSNSTPSASVSMSIASGNYPMDRLSLYTMKFSGSNFQFLSGSTIVANTSLPKPFTYYNNTNKIGSSSSDMAIGFNAAAGGWNNPSGSFIFPFVGYTNAVLFYTTSLSLERIEQNTYSLINGFTSSVNLRGCVPIPIPTTTTTTTAAPTTTTTSTTTTTTSTTTTTTSTTTTLAPQIITTGLSSYLNFRNFFSASVENNDLWYDSVQLVSESACSRVIGIDSSDEGCGENRPECGVYLSTGSFTAWDWPNVFNCNKSVFFNTGSFASSSNQTYVFYGAWDKDSNYGFIRNRNYQTSLQRANKIYSSGSNIVLETYWNNNTTHTLELPISASTFTSSSLSMMTVRVENGNTASVFQNGNLILTKETSSLNFQSLNQGYTYWLDSDDVSDYTMFAHSMLIYTASLTNNQISALSTAINNNITGSY